MFLTPSRQSTEKVAALDQLLEKRGPDFRAFLTVHKRPSVTDNDRTVASSREQDNQPLWCTHEADVALLVASCQACDDNIALLTLEVVNKHQ